MMTVSRATLAVAFISGMAATAAAEGLGSGRHLKEYDPKPADCTCPAKGRQFELGDLTCLMSPKGPRLAQCIMVLNNPAWNFLERDCPDARAPITPRHHAGLQSFARSE